MHRLPLLALTALAMLSPAGASELGCRPCAGVVVDDPAPVLALLSDPAPPRLGHGSVLFLRWGVPLDGSASIETASRCAANGVRPWLELLFTTPPPLAGHEPQLAAELAAAVTLARGAPEGARFQISWPGGDPSAHSRDYGFLLKRAAVAIKGASPGSGVVTAPLPARPDALRALYAEGVDAYIDSVSIVPPVTGDLGPAVDEFMVLDPGIEIVLDAVAWPDPPDRALAIAAAAAADGVAVTLFDTSGVSLSSATLAPLEILATEFAGDLAFDAYSTPEGVPAWAFVRSEDLGLRVVVDQSTTEHDQVRFSDGSLHRPVRVDLDGSEHPVIYSRGGGALTVPVDWPASVSVLRIERPSAAELGGFADQVEVVGEAEIPVEEILRRLQVFEDAHRRRLRHYEATYTQHLRYRPGSGLAPIEATFVGPLFFRQGQGFDWVWQRFLVNGVRWRGDIPELPLIQPAKASQPPLEITLDTAYRYRLVGTDTVAGRDCWVVDFEPALPVEGRRLWKGTVWIDREISARVRTRALQLGLSGDVLSNQETQHFEPLDGNGRPTSWSREAFIVPTRVVGRELQSILNVTLQVEKESLLSGFTANRGGFDDRLASAWSSSSTMVRDTPDGLRYLEPQEDGTRQVQEGFRTDRWFLIGGVYSDATLDFPLPLVGVDFFSSDFRDTGTQVNVIFAGVIVTANWADPDFLGSRWDAGARLSGFFFPRKIELYRDGVKAEEETVKRSDARAALFLGRPLTPFTKLDLTFGLAYEHYSRGDDAADDFVVPQSTFTPSFGLGLSYTRAGWQLSVDGQAHRRSTWEPWGLPGNTDYDPDQREYLKWKASLTKTFWLSDFTKIGVQAEHLDGTSLDRFSKYDFDVFSEAKVAGYQSGLVTATEADVVRLNYGFNLGEVLRLEVQGDVAWATDADGTLNRELLAGVSLGGNVIGPWQTLVAFDVGIPVAGPANDFTARIAFLKLFN